jgi:hypothetical protein
MTVNITQYKYQGKWGPFKLKSACEECNLTTQIIQDMMKNEFMDKDVVFETKPWLDNWIGLFLKGAWHAPIILVNGKKFYVYNEKNPLFNRKELVDLVLSKLKSKKEIKR